MRSFISTDMFAVAVNQDRKLLVLDVIKLFLGDDSNEEGPDFCCREQALFTTQKLLKSLYSFCTNRIYCTSHLLGKLSHPLMIPSTHKLYQTKLPGTQLAAPVRSHVLALLGFKGDYVNDYLVKWIISGQVHKLCSSRGRTVVFVIYGQSHCSKCVL